MVVLLSTEFNYRLLTSSPSLLQGEKGGALALCHSSVLSIHLLRFGRVSAKLLAVGSRLTAIDYRLSFVDFWLLVPDYGLPTHVWLLTTNTDSQLTLSLPPATTVPEYRFGRPPCNRGGYRQSSFLPGFPSTSGRCVCFVKRWFLFRQKPCNTR